MAFHRFTTHPASAPHAIEQIGQNQIRCAAPIQQTTPANPGSIASSPLRTKPILIDIPKIALRSKFQPPARPRLTATPPRRPNDKIHESRDRRAFCRKQSRIVRSKTRLSDGAASRCGGRNNEWSSCEIQPSSFRQSTPGRTRTCDPGIRNPMLYPAELPGHSFLPSFPPPRRESMRAGRSGGPLCGCRWRCFAQGRHSTFRL